MQEILKSPNVINDEEMLLLAQVRDQVKLERKWGNNHEKFQNLDFEERVKKLSDLELKPSKISVGLGAPPRPPSISELRKETETMYWCCICNEDGHVTCQECDDDVYCNSCFREGHKDDLDLRKHIASKLIKSL